MTRDRPNVNKTSSATLITQGQTYVTSLSKKVLGKSDTESSWEHEAIINILFFPYLTTQEI